MLLLECFINLVTNRTFSHLFMLFKSPTKTIGSQCFTIFLPLFFRPGGVFPLHVDYYESEGELTNSEFGNRIALPMIFLNRWVVLVEILEDCVENCDRANRASAFCFAKIPSNMSP